MNIVPFLNQKVAFYEALGKGPTGKLLYASMLEIGARIEPNIQLVRTTGGETLYSKARIFTYFRLKQNDKLIFNSIEYVVLNAEQCYDLAGNYTHTESLC